MNEDFFNHDVSFEDYITGNKFIDIADSSSAVFSKTDFILEHKESEISTFITHNSDYHIDERVFKFKPKGLKRWYAQNKDYESESLFCIPIGLENMKLRVSNGSKMGRYSSCPENGMDKGLYISDLSSKENNHKSLVYMNHNVNTFPLERGFVSNLFKDKNWVTKKSNIHWSEYYKDISSHKFSICPRGNGVDSHRTWESLYLRTIPIVRKSIAMNEFQDLPILFIDDWNCITEEFLLKSYEEMKSKLYNLSKMKISYWHSLIKNN